MYKTIVEAVIDYASHTPDKLAIAFKNNTLTYRELTGIIYKLSLLLSTKYGVSTKDIIMLNAISKPEFVAAFLAIQFLGGTVVTVDKAALSDTVISMYRNIKPKLFITDANIPDEKVNHISLKMLYAEAQDIQNITLEDIKQKYIIPDMNNIAEIIFTTGTTGKPKGAMLSYENILYSTLYTRDGIHRNSECIELIPLPLNHSFGLRVLRSLLYCGASIVLQNGFMFPKELTNNIEKYKCTGISIVPASVEKLYRNMGNDFATVFGNLNYMEISAGSLSTGMKQKLLNVIPKVHLYNTWGSSESGGVFFLDVTNNPEHLGSLGQCPKDVEVCMVSEDGKRYIAKSINNAGRMAIKGKMQMRGYYNMSEETNKTIVDGYLYTGDIAYITEDDFVYMLGRYDDIIKVGGENVSPVEIENTASLYEGVYDCACVGVDDPEEIFGQVPWLYIVPIAGIYDEKELSDFLSRKLEQYKLPKKYVEINEIPRNSMKKADRKKLKALSLSKTGELLNNPVINAIYQRRSVREFTNTDIPREILQTIVNAGMQAPSGHNMQTWHFTVVTNKEYISRLRKTVSMIAERENVYFYGYNNPNALILVSNDTRNRYGIQDSSCAAMNMMLAAHSLGIGTVWINVLMTICNEPEIRALLSEAGVPDEYNVWATIACGYPEKIPSALAKKENVVNWVE